MTERFPCDGAVTGRCETCVLRPFLGRDFAEEVIVGAFSTLAEEEFRDPDSPASAFDIMDLNPYDGIGISSEDAGVPGTEDNAFARAIIICYNKQHPDE